MNRFLYFINNLPKVTKNLIFINVLVFIATSINEPFMIKNFAMFFPIKVDAHFYLPYHFKIWQLITHMFMHGGFFHLFFNMYALVIFGSVVERVLGSKKFLIFYLVTGLGAVALQVLTQYIELSFIQNPEDVLGIFMTPMVGASGALYGVLIGFAMFYPNSVLTLILPPVSLKAKYFVLIFAGLELFMGLGNIFSSIAHFAHLGGMLFGFLLILFWKKTGKIYY